MYQEQTAKRFHVPHAAAVRTASSRLVFVAARAATSSAGVRRRDLDRDLHGEMVRRAAEPSALQRDRLARLMHDRDAHEILIPDHAARRIEVDPARAGNIDLDPGMGVAAGDASSSSSSARCRYPDTNRAAMPSERSAAIMSTARSRQLPLRELQRLDRVLDSLLVPRHVLEGPLDGLRHVDEKLVGVGRSVLARGTRRAQRSSSRMRGQRRDEAREAGPVFRRVGKRIGAGKILDIGCAKAGRRVVEADGALEAELGGPRREIGRSRHDCRRYPASRSAGSARA